MKSPFYIPCDDDNFPFVVIVWAGFSTNNQELCEQGWRSKCFYNHFTKKWLWRFHHPIKLMTFQFKLNSICDLDGKVLEVDNISVGGYRNRRATIKDFIIELCEQDIPEMLAAIVELQKKSRKKQIQERALPSADIVNIRDIA